MAQKRRTSRASSGKMKKIIIAREERRQKRLAERKNAGKGYEYKPNPYNKGSKEWVVENNLRREKTVIHKPASAIWDSIMAKLNNEVEAEKLKAKTSR